jgi:hypothetical protein
VEIRAPLKYESNGFRSINGTPAVVGVDGNVDSGKIGRLLSKDNKGSRFSIGANDLVCGLLEPGAEIGLIPGKSDSKEATFTDGFTVAVGNVLGGTDSTELGLAKGGNEVAGKIPPMADSNGLRSTSTAEVVGKRSLSKVVMELGPASGVTDEVDKRPSRTDSSELMSIKDSNEFAGGIPPVTDTADRVSTSGFGNKPGNSPPSVDTNGLRSNRGRLGRTAGGVTRELVPGEVVVREPRAEGFALIGADDNGLRSRDGITLNGSGAVENLETTLTEDVDTSPKKENTGLRLIRGGIVNVGKLGSVVTPEERSP